MKKTFFIFLLASLSFSVQASPMVCWDPMSFLSMINDLVKDPCKDKLGDNLVSSKINDEYCGCLVQNKGGIFNLIKDSKVADPLVAQKIEDAAVQRKERLDRLYRYLNFEVAAQEQKYELTDMEKQVGCTSKSMASTFQKALCNEGSCKLPDSTGTSNSDLLNFPVKYSFTLSPKAGGSQKSKSARDGIVKQNLDNAVQFAKLKPEEMKKVFSSLETDKYNKSEQQEIEIITASLKTEAEKLAEIDNVTVLANERIANENATSGVTTEPILSPYEIAFQTTFKQADERIQKQFEIDNKNSIPGACLNYDDFKIMDGIPTPEMMNKWAKSSPQMISKSFLAGNLKTDPAVLNFLRRNPVIAKNVISDDQRNKLAESLYEFANANKNADAETLVDKYAVFMKTKIKSLNEENQMASLLQCDLLAQNYAAAADPQVSLAFVNSEENRDLSDIANNLKVCQVREDNKLKQKSNVPNLDEIVNANELFAIFESAAAKEGDMFSPAHDKGYQDFIRDNCDADEMAKIEKDRTSGPFRCLIYKSKKCVERARDINSGRRGRILSDYYKKHPKLGRMVAAINRNTKKIDFDQVANKTNEKKQNNEVRTAYEKYVKPAVMNRSMYDLSNAMGSPVGSGSTSSNSAIVDAVNKAQESYTATHTGSQIAESGHTSAAPATSVASSGATQKSAATSANPGQYIPPFLDSPKAVKTQDTPKISNIDEARDVLEDMVDAPEDEKADLANKAKEYLNAQDQTNSEIADLQKKLADYEQKKMAAPAAVADNTKVATRAPASVGFAAPTATNRVSNIGPQAASNSVSPSSSGYAKLSSGSTVSKAAASYASALNQANESRTDAKSLSLAVESGAVFDFNNSPMSRPSGELVIGTSLEPSDKLFAEISSDPDAMKSYLAQNLKEIPVDKVVSIKCKGAGCNAGSSEILLVITKGSDNKFSIRSVSRETKVARSHRIQDLKNEINKVVR